MVKAEQRRSATWILARRNKVLDASDTHGRLECFSPRPGLWVSCAEGRLTADMACRGTAAFDRMPDDEPYDVLNDWSQLESYEPEARQVMTASLRRHRPRIRCAHFYVTNRLVAMGVAAAGLVVSFSGFELKSYTSGKDFDAAIARLLDDPRFGAGHSVRRAPNEPPLS